MSRFAPRLGATGCATRWRSSASRPPGRRHIERLGSRRGDDGGMTVAPPLRIALYAGIFVHRDAVSNSLRHKLDALRRLVELGAPLEITVFTQASDDVVSEVHVVDSVAELIAYQEFWSADVHIFQEAMYYDLLHSVSNLR